MLIIAELAQMEEPDRRVHEADAVRAATLAFLHIILAMYNRKTGLLLKKVQERCTDVGNFQC